VKFLHAAQNRKKQITAGETERCFSGFLQMNVLRIYTKEMKREKTRKHEYSDDIFLPSF
jgi:hypothetical protein